MSYQDNLSKSELNRQLLTGLKKHLEIAQTTSFKKEERLLSLRNVGEVLEYVVSFINEAVPEEEQAILYKFFMRLLVNVKRAESDIHFKPSNFNEEIVFINVLLNL